MIGHKKNTKSDVQAKETFIQELLHDFGFAEAKVRSSADITAQRDGKNFYFQFKYTTQENQYFGAMTLTECKAPLTNEETFAVIK